MEASSAIWEAAKCFCGFLKNKATYIYDLEENLQLLEEKSKKLEEKKKDVEALIEEQENTAKMQRSHQVTGWLERVETIQKEIKGIQDRGTKEIQNVCLSKCCTKNCKSSYKLGKNVSKILRNVDELETEGEGFCKDSKVVLKHISKSNEMPCGETLGLDLMFDKVWKSIEETDVGFIGIYGMGGVGKTTLLKKINNELGKRSDFYIIMWVVVSKSPNLDSVMGNIRKLLGIRDELWERCSNQDEKASKIYEVLKEKKFVLLLDDIWDRLDLEKVGVPHPNETNFQSKVLFTTRSKDVCAKMKAQRTFEVQTLTKKEASELFCMKVGEGTLNFDPVIRKIAEEMVEECKGLPLALTVVGSSMSGVESVDAWEHTKNNLIRSSWTSSDWETEVCSILKVSFDRLPDEAHKKCFLYCALYPEDHEILVYDLIEKWIGEGFLYNDGMRSVDAMRRNGGSIIEKLKCSCLLENVEGDIFLERSIKMHDVIRDMALWIACDQDKNKKKVIVPEDTRAMSQANVENWEMVERISIITEFGAKSHVQLQSIAWINLITLILNIDGSRSEINGLQNIQHARKLKVLELRGVQDVPILIEIGSLNLLEYLSLELSSLTNASDLWINLKNLRNLKVFDLFLFDDNDTPLELISNLHQLKVFRLRTCGTYIPGLHEREQKKFQDLEDSSNLEELWVEIKSESGLSKLFKSAKLQSCIYGLGLERYEGQVNMPLFLSTMSKMEHLQRVSFQFVDNVIDPSVYNSCCLSTLRSVEIFMCNTIHHLTWLKYAPLLQQLVVLQCSSIEEVIKGEILEDGDEKDRENVDSIFLSLVELYLYYLPNLRRIHERVLPFPFLRSIEVNLCENLKKLPLDSNSAKAKLELIRGSRVWWNNLEWDDPTVKATFHSKYQEFDF